MKDPNRLKKKNNPVRPPIVSLVGSSGAGKTTFLEKLIPELVRRGFRVGTIKHDVHGFEMDTPGKDSWRHKHAGAVLSMIASPFQVGMVMDVDHDHSPEELLPLISGVDIILTEGYKKAGRIKVEVFRPDGRDKTPLCANDDALIALVSDVAVDLRVPRFPLSDVKRLAGFLITRFKLKPSPFR